MIPLNVQLVIWLQAKLKAQATFEDKFSAREKEKRKDEDDDRLTLRLNIPHILQKYLLDEGFHLRQSEHSMKLNLLKVSNCS
jgi:hypothetical protein